MVIIRSAGDMPSRFGDVLQSPPSSFAHFYQNRTKWEYFFSGVLASRGEGSGIVHTARIFIGFYIYFMISAAPDIRDKVS